MANVSSVCRRFLVYVCFFVCAVADADVAPHGCVGQGCQDRGSNLLQVQREKDRISDGDEEDDQDEDGPVAEVGSDELYGELTLATTVVMVNVTNYTGLIMSEENVQPNTLSHKFGVDPAADLDLLFEKSDGFFSVMHEFLGNDADLCPRRSFSSIMRCIGIAICALSKVVPAKLSLEAFTLLVELGQRFEAITWPELEQVMDESGMVKMNGELLVPPQYACDLTDDTQTESLIELSMKKDESSSLSTALRTSLSMERAMRLTHKALDDHGTNASIHPTIAAFRKAWQPFCQDVTCDHTNYWDIYGVSHAHTGKLIQAGASVHHLRNHIKNRMSLELKVQKFLSVHGDEFAESAYRVVGESAHHEMQSYFGQGKAALRRDTLAYVLSQGDDAANLLRHFDDNRFAAFVSQRIKATDVGNLTDISSSQALVETNSQELLNEEGLVKYGGRRRRRRRVFKVIGDGIKSVVNSVVDFVKDLFACVGSVKSLAAVGYCKKFPLPTSVVGVGVGFGASVGEDLGSLLQGTRVPNIRIFMGMVVGAVPGSPVTGGIRTGIGVGGRVACTPSTCNLGISVGAVAAALWPTMDPQCFFGTFLIGFRCMKGGGVSVSILCCHFDLVTGAENCR